MKTAVKSSNKTEFFHKDSLRMEYAKWGDGKMTLFAFHGFGRSHRDYIAFTEPLKSAFTVYAFNIFFHEGSEIGQRSGDQKPLKPSELFTFFSAFLAEIAVEKFWIMGFSLGGRIALKLAELLPEKVMGLYLFAPDGLIVNRWYALFSHYTIGRKAFRFFIKNNPAMFKTLDFIIRFGLISTRLGEFIRGQIRNREMQQQVYNVWTFLRYIEPDFKKLGRVLRAQDISVDVFFGKYDKIIPEENVTRLRKVYPKTKVRVLESGHAMLSGKNMDVILKKGWMQIAKT